MEKKDVKQNAQKGNDTEKIHWSDQVAEEVEKRIESDPKLKEIVKKQGILVYDEKTPSGVIHVGSARGWIIHDCIAKALRKRGHNAKFILSSDDMDPYDKPNKDLDSSWDQYLGMAFRDIPSPIAGYDSFGAYFFSQVTEKFPEWGIECELESTGQRYVDGSFNEAIKTLLDKAPEVQKIYAELYGDEAGGANKLPFNVKCPNCKKIATTQALKWDSEKEEVYFECRDDTVKFAKGCGHKGWISPYNGNGKFPWKVEWPAKWPTMGVIYEVAGKDHFSSGGSRTIACKIAVDVLNYPPPLPSYGYETGKGYEFFTVGGAKMSTSKGRGMAFRDITDYAPANMLKYLMVKTRPSAVVDFDPYNDNAFLLLYDRYDKTEDVYFGKTEADADEKLVQTRIYELSHIGKIPKSCPPHISLNNASMIMQSANFNIDVALKIARNLNMIKADASPEDLEYVKDRLKFSQKWVTEFASDQYRFKVTETLDPAVKAKLSDVQISSLKSLKKILEAGDYDEKTLFEEFYKIKEECGIEMKDFFKAAYLVIISKEQGPKLAPFILTLGKKTVLHILEQV